MQDIAKQVIIMALYYYQNNADAEEQIDCLHQFVKYKHITLETDPDERATLFENVIRQTILELINLR